MNKKDELIRKRDILQNERNKINNNKVSKTELYLYVLGVALTSTISAILFLETAPVLIHLFSFLYTVGAPGVYFGKRIYKDNKLENEIDDLDRKICNIERQEFHEQSGSLLAQITYEQENQEIDSAINTLNSIQSKEGEHNEDFSAHCVMKYCSTRIPSSRRFPGGYEVAQVRYAYSSPKNYKSTKTERDYTKKPGVLYMDSECFDEDEISQEQSGPVKKLTPPKR